MIDTTGIKQDMEVITANGRHVGTVTDVETHRIKVFKANRGDGVHMGHRQFIASALVAGVEGNKVRLSSTASAITMEDSKAQ